MQLSRATCVHSCEDLLQGGREWLHQAARPGHHTQRDFILLQLQHGDERGVVHSHSRSSVHRHDLIATPGREPRVVNTECGLKRR